MQRLTATLIALLVFTGMGIQAKQLHAAEDIWGLLWRMEGIGQSLEFTRADPDKSPASQPAQEGFGGGCVMARMEYDGYFYVGITKYINEVQTGPKVYRIPLANGAPIPEVQEGRLWEQISAPFTAVELEFTDVTSFVEHQEDLYTGLENPDKGCMVYRMDNPATGLWTPVSEQGFGKIPDGIKPVDGNTNVISLVSYDPNPGNGTHEDADLYAQTWNPRGSDVLRYVGGTDWEIVHEHEGSFNGGLTLMDIDGTGTKRLVTGNGKGELFYLEGETFVEIPRQGDGPETVASMYVYEQGRFYVGTAKFTEMKSFFPCLSNPAFCDIQGPIEIWDVEIVNGPSGPSLHCEKLNLLGNEEDPNTILYLNNAAVVPIFEYEGQLYGGTGSGGTVGSQLWRLTLLGEGVMQAEKVGPAGLSGNTGNFGILPPVEFDGHSYLSVWSSNKDGRKPPAWGAASTVGANHQGSSVCANVLAFLLIVPLGTVLIRIGLRRRSVLLAVPLALFVMGCPPTNCPDFDYDDSLVLLGDSVMEIRENQCQDVGSYVDFCIEQDTTNLAMSGARITEPIDCYTIEAVQSGDELWVSVNNIPQGTAACVNGQDPCVRLMKDPMDPSVFEMVTLTEIDPTESRVKLAQVSGQYSAGAKIGQGTIPDIYDIAVSGGVGLPYNIPDLSGHEPGVIVTDGGGNDLIQRCAQKSAEDCINEDFPEMKAVMTAFMDRVRAQGVSEIVFLSGYHLKVGLIVPTVDLRDKYNAVIDYMLEQGPASCAENDRCEFLDLSETIGEDDIGADGIHPTPEGAQKIASEICLKLLELGHVTSCSCGAE